MITRRELLQRCSLLALAPSAPVYLARTAGALTRATGERVLVVLQLDGGNDGLNTVVPFRDELYRQARPTLAVAREAALRVSDELGLHPSLGGFVKLLEQDRLAIVQGVGYPNPNYSHDVNRLVWQTARISRDDHKLHGWLGRAFDTAPPQPQGVPAFLSCGNEPRPHALFARRAVCATLRSLDEYDAADFGAIDGAAAVDATEEFVRQTSREARRTVERLRSLARADGGARYPATELGRRLELVARLVKSGLETPVYYVQQPGYDTHAVQRDAHATLLRTLGDALHMFLTDLEASGHGERVLVLVTSEFGRRVAENASYGTDHGSGAPLFLAGRQVVPGLHGPVPRLDATVDGNVAPDVDFRTVYAAVLERWLGLDPKAALGGTYEPAGVLRV